MWNAVLLIVLLLWPTGALAGEVVFRDFDFAGNVFVVEKTDGRLGEYFWYFGVRRYRVTMTAETKAMFGVNGEGEVAVTVKGVDDNGVPFEAKSNATERDHGRFGTVAVYAPPSPPMYWSDMTAGHAMLTETFQHWLRETGGHGVSFPGQGLRATPGF